MALLMTPRNALGEVRGLMRTLGVARSLRTIGSGRGKPPPLETHWMKNNRTETDELPCFPRTLLDRPTIKAIQAQLAQTTQQGLSRSCRVASMLLRRVWTAVCFGKREIAAAILVLCGIAMWGTVSGFGPFDTLPPQDSLLLLQAFVGITALMALALSAVVSEHRKVETELQRLAASDPLTGLANYRKFIDTLTLEIKRSERSERPFAILFLDVDELKLLNDREGHVVGNQALCKVANVIQGSCRSIDTLARFGGDEFALILPDADEEAAVRVADRISTQLATRADGPHVTVSIGIAVYPRHGESIESLLSAADSVLYQAKSRCRKISGDRRSIVNLPAAMFERNAYRATLKNSRRLRQQQH
jgi:diguanylate cyclase (GGDEF)-like protein